VWTDLQEAAFEVVKRAADKPQVLRPIDYNKPDMIWLFTDASRTGTRSWIAQGPTRDASRLPGFHSRKLTLSQSNYLTQQQETRAIIEAMEAFAPHLLHRQFTVVTDHESLTKLMTQKNLNRRQQRWLTHISDFDCKIEYEPGAKNFLADYLSGIYFGTLRPLDISLKERTIDYESLELPDPIKPLQINTSYASSSDFGIASDDVMYHSGEAQTSPTLTSSDSISRCRPEYLIDEITGNAVTRSPKRKALASLPAISSAASNNSRISIGNSWGDNRTLPISSEMERGHSEMSCMSCTHHGCEIYEKEKEDAGYWPKDPQVRKQSKKIKRKEQDRTSTSNTALEAGQASLPNISYLSESLPPFRINDTILATPRMASPAFSPLYRQAGYDSYEATNANQFLSTIHSRRMGILTLRAREALKTDALYTSISKNNTLRSVRSVRLTHLTLERKSRTRTQPPYHTMRLTQPDAAPNPHDAPDAAPDPQNAPDAAPYLQDATRRRTSSSGYSAFSTHLPEISELEGYSLYFS